MAAIKFSKQNIRPNPLEVDYWVDVTSNPYGGNIKYYNGYDWVDLFSSEKATVNLDDYFTKSQINQMLSTKASIESVNTKVDDAEIADVIKNIEIKDRDDSGVELVLLKYDDTTVGVTLPAASSTTSGVLTADEFKNMVKQYQLQELYTEMYDKLAEIRNKYQLKLTAGKGIDIDVTTNTISALNNYDIEWEDFSEETKANLIENIKDEISDNINAAIDTVNVALDDVRIATNAANSVIDSAKKAENTFIQYVEELSSYEEEINDQFNEFRTNVTDLITNIEQISNAANDTSIISANKADNAVIVANAAKQAVATLEGLSNIDTSTIVAASVVTQVEQNRLDIQNILNNEIVLTEAEYNSLEIKDPVKKYYIY